MDFYESLKATAKYIIELSGRLSDRVRTWDQEKSAPTDGYTDRAGFLYYDEKFELYADVCSSDDENRHLLRARLAQIDQDDSGGQLFTMMTLDFAASPEKTKALINNSNKLTRQMLVELLDDPDTMPAHIHTSLNSGVPDAAGETQGKRYEYDTENLQSMTEQDRQEFLETLNKAYEKITKDVGF